jgi:hypothetical protein
MIGIVTIAPRMSAFSSTMFGMPGTEDAVGSDAALTV